MAKSRFIEYISFEEGDKVVLWDSVVFEKGKARFIGEKAVCIENEPTYKNVYELCEGTLLIMMKRTGVKQKVNRKYLKLISFKEYNNG